MANFFDKYLNPFKMAESKREYKRQMARVDALPEDYRFIFKKIQSHMWQFAAGDGYDMLELHYGLIDLFEAGAAEGKTALEVTGEDVAGFVDELLKSVKTYTAGWRESLNRDVAAKLKKEGNANERD
jgi:DNA-binding ferritin-like protein (Dps family)